MANPESMWSAASDNRGGLRVPSSVTDQIASILESEILRGAFTRGAHLQQDEICRRFGVSRTPAREALRKLQVLGLIELIPNKGARVLRPTLGELRETYQVRAVLEGFAARLACENQVPSVIDELDEIQDSLRQFVKENPVQTQHTSAHAEQLKRHNDRFHYLIHETAGNLRLQGSIDNLERYFPKDIVRESITDPGDLEKFYVTDHDEVLEAMKNLDPTEAEHAMRRHIQAAQAFLLNYLAAIGYES